MTKCKSCEQEHFIPNEIGLCLKCDMKSKKSASIQKTKTESLADYQKKQIPLEPIEPVITIDMF